ncbi:NepR family anti-sigma factor [Methylobacterium marchantiae]|uniref:NepR family anti-sigma factor n=1 Tax=Methylobacterium marchantiae TaxID=600331 RepID=A0ABW3X3H8_9HYPH|nr:hypothetical protein AIGOOFII_3874 [Methylobacterium marchantiae]
MTIDASDTHSPSEAENAANPASGIQASRAGPRSDAGLSTGGTRSGMDRETRRRIGRNLRILYGNVLDLPLPDRFEALLAELSDQPASLETS